MNWKETKQLTKDSILEFSKENSLMHGAALAYYALLALVPLLYLCITYFGQLVGEEAILEMVSKMLEENVGLKDTSGIMEFLSDVDLLKGSPFLKVLGALALMFSCTVIFNSLKGSINEFYDIEKSKIGRKSKIIRSLGSRLLSFGLVIGFTLFFILLYFAEPIFLSLGSKLFDDAGVLNTVYAMLMKHLIPILTNLVVFGIIFKYLHDGKVEWINALKGAVLTSVLLHAGQLIIKFYLTHYFFGASGGVVGAMLIILAWVYYSSQIIFFGAKYIAVLSRMKGVPIKFKA